MIDAFTMNRLIRAGRCARPVGRCARLRRPVRPARRRVAHMHVKSKKHFFLTAKRSRVARRPGPFRPAHRIVGRGGAAAKPSIDSDGDGADGDGSDGDGSDGDGADGDGADGDDSDGDDSGGDDSDGDDSAVSLQFRLLACMHARICSPSSNV